MERKEVKCPKCGSEKNQHKKGFTVAGSQRMFCNDCGCKYTPNPKSMAYSEEVRNKRCGYWHWGTPAEAWARH